jgi:uncharacterized membrane protein
MSTCASCGADLQAGWKYCVFCGSSSIPGAIRPPVPELRRINRLAIFALVLGSIGGALALVFGHIAMAQIRQTGERGMSMARGATILGYMWLGVEAIVVISVVTSGRG